MSHVRVLQGKRSLLALINENSPPCLNRETNETFVSLVIWMLAEKFCHSFDFVLKFSLRICTKEQGRQGLFFFLYMFSRKAVICIQTHHVVTLHSVIPWSVIGLERWKSLCGTITLGEFTYQFVSWLSKSNQSCRSPNVCGACSYFLKIKYKHEQ